MLQIFAIFETHWFWNGVSGFGDFGMKLFCLVLQGTRDSVVVIATWLAGRPWQLRNRGSFPGRGNIFLYSPTGPDRLKGPFIQLVLEVLLPVLWRMKLINHLPIIPRLRMSGVVSSFSSSFSHMSK